MLNDASDPSTSTPQAFEGPEDQPHTAQSPISRKCDDLDLPRLQDIHNIWDDERGAGRDDEDDVDMDDMDNFIDDDEDEQGGIMDEEEREERRRERRRQERERRKALGSKSLPGIDAR